MTDPSASRKNDHLHICADEDVTFREKTTLFEDVELIHEALPDFSLASVDTETVLFSKALAAPFLISAMSGGIPEADRMNQSLAETARELGVGLGLGSQRSALEGGEDWPSLRQGNSDPLLILGNIGLAQAKDAEPSRLTDLVNRVGADALCVHLNPAQEWFQPEGDLDFGGGVEALSTLCDELSVPLIVKETGCGISASTAVRLREAGVAHIDVAGAGGTTWVGVELERMSPTPTGWAAPFREWGIPTAVSVVTAAGMGFETVVASGGLRTGLEAAKALALGAHAAGFALPVLRAWRSDGPDGVKAFFADCLEGLKTAMALSGAQKPGDLKGRFVVTHPRLHAWMDGLVRAARAREGGAEPQSPPGRS
ncbi:MAG: type 2 isopentenyl-diphosphate Delta-isomerase [Planctomycetota bacterium]|jgi:isopentenyl-diphosphate delta-isomerase